MNIINLTISNMHPRGFAFGISGEGEQCFVPPHVVDGRSINRGDSVWAQVVLNPNLEQRSNTKWCAVNFIEDQAKDVDVEALVPNKADRTPEVLDAEVLEIIQEDCVVTTAIIADATGTDTKTAGNSANRLFNAGHIAKADVYARCGLQRPNFIMWAAKASDFLEVE